MAKITRPLQRICLALLAVLTGAGVTGCMYGPGMYGPPQNTVSGTVTNAAGQAIPGIHLTATDHGRTWTATTSDFGNYDFRLTGATGDSVTITAADVDGPANGGDFATAVQTIVATDSYQHVDFTLTPKD